MINTEIRYLVPTKLNIPVNAKLKDLFFLSHAAIKEINNEKLCSILRHPWVDIHLFQKDKIKIRNYYGETLELISEKLNLFHKVDYPVKYWEILIGPWLCLMIEVTYERWICLQEVNNGPELFKYEKNLHVKNSNLANTFREFSSIAMQDNWNDELYSQLIDLCNFKNIIINIKEKIYFKDNKYTEKKKSEIHMNYFLNLIKKIIHLINFCNLNSKYFLIQTGLSFWAQFHLQLMLRQLPGYQLDRKLPIFLPSDKKRDEFEGLFGYHVDRDDFRSILIKLIPNHIPKCFLEGYQKSLNYIHSTEWPKSPRVIFTSYLYSSSDALNFYMAEKMLSGAKIVISQHGGSYGMHEKNSDEEHQFSISNAWISWGWKYENSNIHPMGITKKMPNNIMANDTGGLLIITQTYQKFSHRISGCLTNAYSYVEYLSEQFRFVEKVLPDYKRLVTVRLYPEDFETDQEMKWRNKFEQINIEIPSRINFYKSVSMSSLCICTYNSTTVLELLSLNIPLVCFWNMESNVINKMAEVHFLPLIQSGILHKTPESAAQHVLRISENVSEWWNLHDVQNSRRQFIETFAKKNNNIKVEIKNLLESM